MSLLPAHKELIKLLAAEAVDQFLEEHPNLLQTQERKPMDNTTGENPHVHGRTHSD